MKLVSLLFLVSLTANAGTTFVSESRSGRSIADAMVNAQARANQTCGRRAVRASKWAQSQEARYTTRCSGRAEDKICDDYYVGMDYTAWANFSCR